MATVKDLIEEAGGTAKEAVEAAKTRYLDQVRGILRDLTRLKFSERQGVEAQHTSVPIRVVPGMPKALEPIANDELPSGEHLGIETIGLWANEITSLASVAEKLQPLTVKLSSTLNWESRGRDYTYRLRDAVRLAKELAGYLADDDEHCIIFNNTEAYFCSQPQKVRLHTGGSLKEFVAAQIQVLNPTSTLELASTLNRIIGSSDKRVPSFTERSIPLALDYISFVAHVFLHSAVFFVPTAIEQSA